MKENLDFNTIKRLLTQTNFVDWVKAKGNDAELNLYWGNWIQENPKFESEFDIAQQVINSLSFKEAIPSVELETEILKRILDAQSIYKANKPKRYQLWKKSAFIRYGVGVAACLILIFSLYITQKNDSKQQVEIAEQIWQIEETPYGERRSIQLPDSSLVWLNAGTKLEYLISNEFKERLVKLDGEAFFQVKHNNSPFKVITGGFETQVLGTSFNIINNKNEQVNVALVEGQIQFVETQSNKGHILDPGYMLTYNKNTTGTIKKEPFDIKRKIAWKDNRLVFIEATFIEVIGSLEKWYDVSFVYDKKNMPQWQYNAVFSNKDLKTVMENLALTQNINYSIKNKIVTLRYQ